MEGEGKWRGLLIRGGRGGEKGRGRSPPGYYGFPPGSRGARIVTASDGRRALQLTASSINAEAQKTAGKPDPSPPCH